MEFDCIFEKEYEEPTESYNLVSFSVFYLYKYFSRFELKDKEQNISIIKQFLFLYNLTANIENLQNNFLPKNWYFRIYYDDSIFSFNVEENNPWKHFIKNYKKNKRVQFVKFKCPQFLSKIGHKNLFGTLLRLYPLFEKNDNIKTIVIFDADNFITKDYLNEIIKFEKSHYDINIFSSKYEFSLYQDSKYNKDYYIRTGMLSSKVKFDKMAWLYIMEQLKLFNNKEFIELLKRLNKKSQVFFDKFESYEEFEYGIDEIVINFFLARLINANNFNVRVVRYSPSGYNLSHFLGYLKYNYSRGKPYSDYVKIIMKDLIECHGLEYKDMKTNFDNYYDKLKSEKCNEYECLKKDIDVLRKNIEYVEKLYNSSIILKFIKNLSEEDFKYRPFGDYFVSLRLPFYLMSKGMRNIIYKSLN